MRKYSLISFSLEISHTSVNFETDYTQLSTIHKLIATFFFVLVIGNWVIGFFNPITSIDNANYLVYRTYYVEMVHGDLLILY